MPNFQKIHDASLKPKQKNINQTIFQGGSPWATLIHNSMCGWRVHYCVQLLPEVIFFSNIPFTFSFTINIPYTFSFVKVFSFN